MTSVTITNAHNNVYTEPKYVWLTEYESLLQLLQRSQPCKSTKSTRIIIMYKYPVVYTQPWTNARPDALKNASVFTRTQRTEWRPYVTTDAIAAKFRRLKTVGQRLEWH